MEALLRILSSDQNMENMETGLHLLVSPDEGCIMETNQLELTDHLSRETKCWQYVLRRPEIRAWMRLD